MPIILVRTGKERIYYEAVPFKRVNEKMDGLLDGFNSELAVDAASKAAIAHLWFHYSSICRQEWKDSKSDYRFIACQSKQKRTVRS